MLEPSTESLAHRRTTVFVSGCWDLLHPGHVEALEFAATLGSHLIVSIASDATIRALKREPVLCEHDRFRLVSALRCVDEAFVCRGEPGAADCFTYVRNLRPDVWVINADDQNAEAKRALAAELGIRLVYNHRPEAGASTTSLIERLRGDR